MGSNSLYNIIDELKTVTYPMLNKSVKCTQTTPRKRIFDKNYLIHRLYQPKERCTRCKHDNTINDYKNDWQRAKQRSSNSKDVTSQKHVTTNRNLKKDNISLLNKKEIKLLYNNNTLTIKDDSEKFKNKTKSDFKTKSNREEVQSVITENSMQNKARHLYSMRQNNNDYKHEDKFGDKQETLVEGNQYIQNRSIAWQDGTVLRRKSTSELQSIIKNKEKLPQEYNSQVKQLTDYWNSLLNSEFKEQNDSESHADRIERFKLLTKKFSQYQKERTKWCFSNDHLVKPRHIPETKIHQNYSSKGSSANYSFDKHLYYNNPNLINSTGIDCKFQVNSETSLEINKPTLIPISPFNIRYVNILGPMQGIIYPMSRTLFCENVKINSDNNLLRTNENNAKSNRLCLKYTINEEKTSSESSLGLIIKENASDKAVESVNLEKVQQAIQMINYCKDQLWIRFVSNKDFFTANNVSNVSFPMTREKVVTLSCQEECCYNIGKVFVRKYPNIWHRTKQFLLNIAIIINNLIHSVFDNIVFYGPLLELIVTLLYHLIVSLFICRLIIQESMKK